MESNLIFSLMDNLIDFTSAIFDDIQSLQDKKDKMLKVKKFCDYVIKNKSNGDFIDKILNASKIDIEIDNEDDIIEIAKSSIKYFSKKNEENMVSADFAILSMSAIMFKFYEEIYNYYQNI